jgi:hydrogenase maturation protease
MLMADDGLGLAALARLEERYDLPESVLLVDGGTWGMNLLPTIEDADRLLLVDAINANRDAGSYIRLERDEIPRYLALKVSPHQVDLSEVLALAELRGTLPMETVAMGLQPEMVVMRTELSACIEAAIEELVSRIAEQLRDWGHDVADRPAASGVRMDHVLETHPALRPRPVPA